MFPRKRRKGVERHKSIILLVIAGLWGFSILITKKAIKTMKNLFRFHKMEIHYSTLHNLFASTGSRTTTPLQLLEKYNK